MNVEIVETHRLFGGEQKKYRHTSKSLNCEMTFSLFLPEDKKNQTTTSLIWWLSGLTCTDDNFSQKSAFQKYASDQNIAFVIPDTSPRGEIADSEDWDLGQGAGFYLNATQDPWRKNYRMYDYLTDELPKIVYTLIPNFSGKESIMGHSMGGHGALILGLKNPSRFASISAFAPIFNPINVPWGQKAFTAYLGNEASNWYEWDATEIMKAGGKSHVPILITQGTNDNFYDVQLKEDTFLAASKCNGGKVIYKKEVGYDHSYFTITTFIEEHISFHKKQLTKS
ncbi:S-formylglutathione hydrolase [Enterococcus casseliflavus]|uniref:S-formylglutathione hydrolase n=1 Tax=Enterococcus casseliflavus TaxID=37734 RepID=UPI002FBE81DF